MGEQLAGIGQGRLKDKSKPKAKGDPNELVVEQRRRRRLKDYDRLLKTFKYSAALDAVLRKVGGLSIFSNSWTKMHVRVLLQRQHSL